MCRLLIHAKKLYFSGLGDMGGISQRFQFVSCDLSTKPTFV